MKQPFVIIRHSRFFIRKFNTHDAPALVEYFGHSAVMKGTRGFSWNYQLADARKYLREKLRQYRRRRPIVKNNEIETLGYAIEVDRMLAGGVGVTLDGRSAEIGYWLAKPLWGQGTMTLVVKHWTRYVFRKFKVAQITAKVFSGNDASVRVLQNNNYFFEYREIKKGATGEKVSDRLIFLKKLNIRKRE